MVPSVDINLDIHLSLRERPVVSASSHEACLEWGSRGGSSTVSVRANCTLRRLGEAGSSRTTSSWSDARVTRWVRLRGGSWIGDKRPGAVGFEEYCGEWGSWGSRSFESGQSCNPSSLSCSASSSICDGDTGRSRIGTASRTGEEPGASAVRCRMEAG